MVKIAVSAGHGGYGVTPGKRGPDGKFEWIWNNAAAIAFIQHLKNFENVQTIRVDDPTGRTDIPLADRVRKANLWGADIYVSFHHNAMGSVWVAHGLGIETFRSDRVSASSSAGKLQAAIHPRIVNAMELKDRGKKTAPFYELRYTKMPAVLLEGGFMDSRVDRLAMDRAIKIQGQGIAAAEGAGAYLNLRKRPGTIVNPKPEIPPEIEVDQSKGIGIVHVKVNSLALRNGPAMDHGIARRLSKGEVYYAYEKKGIWYNLGGGKWASEGVAGQYLDYTSHPNPQKPELPAKPAENPKEEEDMERTAVVINGTADAGTATLLAFQLGCGVFFRKDAEKRQVAKEIYIAGGGKGKIKGDKLIDLSGKTRSDTAKNVTAKLK
ncbi:N-acetylmuramoyl-L-alanine amidase [Planococcus rifietoensis]|uniref:N-acetylmuramoyl-L-alanine amidase n=1 Tax=Planococcus rifietoensis TaxID=200991 RepID=UPI00384F5F1A